jgi:hypothetical protein
VLDASSDSKFSQHIVLPVAGAGYLGSVAQVGQLVTRVAASVVAEMPEVFLAAKLGRFEPVCVVDVSVYNSNQQFRVAYSSKLGQVRPLLPFNKQQHVDLGHCTWEMFASTLVVCGRAVGQGAVAAVAAAANVPETPGSAAAAVVYPRLEALINSQLIGGVLQAARVHRMQPLLHPCLYWSTSSKHCPAVGREHASNHVQVVVNAKLCQWRLHCLDPDCSPGAWQRFDPALVQDLHHAATSFSAWHHHWKQQRDV